MLCPHCRAGRLGFRPTCTGVEVGCQGCSRVLTPEEVRALLDAWRRSPAPPHAGEPGPP